MAPKEKKKGEMDELKQEVDMVRKFVKKFNSHKLKFFLFLTNYFTV